MRFPYSLEAGTYESGEKWGNRSGTLGSLRVFLERLPLRHQVADLPHQRLVTGNHLFRSFAIVEEPRGGHERFELLDLRLALGYPSLEVGNPFLKGLRGAFLLSPLGLLLFTGGAVARLWGIPSTFAPGVPSNGEGRCPGLAARVFRSRFTGG